MKCGNRSRRKEIQSTLKVRSILQKHFNQSANQAEILALYSSYFMSFIQQLMYAYGFVENVWITLTNDFVCISILNWKM